MLCMVSSKKYVNFTEKVLGFVLPGPVTAKKVYLADEETKSN